jgi:hypothetical protein
MGIMSLISGKLPTRGNSDAAQNPEIKGLRAYPGATYFSVSDENGRMDDDLFDLLLEKEVALAD